MPTPSDQTHRRTRFVAALAALLVVLPAVHAGAQEVLNRVVIRVNDRIATLHDYDKRVSDLTEQITRSDLPLTQRRQRIVQVPEQVFQEMFQELLLLSRADQAGIIYSEAELDEQAERMKANFGITTEEQFQQALASQNLTQRGFREQMETGMRIQELVGREVRSQIDTSEDLAREYYRDHPEQFTTPRRLHLREVVVLEDGALGPDERQARAAEIRSRAAAGTDLASLTEEGVTSGVIDLGWVTARELADELEAAVWELGAGEVSQPVAGRGGIHVLQVVERQEEGLRPFNEVAEDATNRAGAIEFQSLMEQYLEDLEAESYVRVDPPPEAADFRRLGGEALPVPPGVGPAAAAAEPTTPAVRTAASG